MTSVSKARANILKDLDALRDAVDSTALDSASGTMVAPTIDFLRRGVAITGLVILETFVRNRTEELLEELKGWPASYGDFPKRFRARATIDALPHIEKFAKMLRRQGEDYEGEIIQEVKLISSMSPPSFQFTRFFAGDLTGNLSERYTEDLLAAFQIKDCWRSMHEFCTSIGFGVPSIKEILKEIVRNRHQSAHVPAYVPTASDMTELPHNLTAIAICIDAALSVAVRLALLDWRTWVDKSFSWTSELEIFYVEPRQSRFRVKKKGARKAIRIIDTPTDAKRYLPVRKPKKTIMVVYMAMDGRPRKWDIH